MRDHQRQRPGIGRSLPALLCAVAGVTLTACAKTEQRAKPAARMATSTAAGSAKKPIPAWLARLHRFGDYDDDDYNGSNDGDSDDRPPSDRDGDSDNSTGGYYDADDTARSFGHTAAPAQQHAISALARRYFADAAAGLGARACSLLYAPLARTFPRELGQNGPAYLRGATTCPALMSRLFNANRPRFKAYAAKLKIASVRVHGRRAVAVLSFGDLPGRWLELEREGRSWKLSGLVDRELP